MISSSKLGDIGDSFVKLIDFGLASLEYEAKGFVGSPNYISPEIAKAILNGQKSEALNCKTADVYALGLVFYATLTASHPFPEETDRRLLYLSIMKGIKRIPGQLYLNYPEMDILLKSMLNLEDERFSIEKVIEYVGSRIPPPPYEEVVTHHNAAYEIKIIPFQESNSLKTMT